MSAAGRLGVALIGAGRQGQAHLAAVPGCVHVELRAVCDVMPGAAAAVAPAGVAADTALERTLARDDVQAVVIAASTHRHAEIVGAALAAGRHVLCEKPLTLDPSDDARLDALARASGLVLQVGFTRRHGWPYREAARLIAAGAIGAPRMARLAQWDAAAPPAEFLDPAISGGLEIDCGIHEVDTGPWLLGSPIDRIVAVGAPTREVIAAVGDLEAAAALATTVAGHAMTIDLHRSCGYADIVHTEIVGAEGAILIRFEDAGELQLGDPTGLRSVPGPSGEAIRGALAAQLDALALAVAGEPTEAAGAEDSTRALRAARAMRDARVTGGWITL
jgi:predicted dehydrogenase